MERNTFVDREIPCTGPSGSKTCHTFPEDHVPLAVQRRPFFVWTWLMMLVSWLRHGLGLTAAWTTKTTKGLMIWKPALDSQVVIDNKRNDQVQDLTKELAQVKSKVAHIEKQLKVMYSKMKSLQQSPFNHEKDARALHEPLVESEVGLGNQQDLKEVAVKDHSNELVNDQFDEFEFQQAGNGGKENCKQEGVGIETNSEADLNLTKEPAKDIDMNSETGSIPDMTEHRSKAGLTGEGVKDMNGETGSIPDMTEHRSKAGLTEETQETEEGVKERDKNVVIDDNAGILFSSEWELEQDLKEVALKDHSNELVNDQFDDFEFRQTGNDGKENCKQEGIGIETNSEADLNLTKEPAKDMNSETGSIPDMTEHRSKAGLTGEGVKDMNGETGSIPDMTEHRSKTGLTGEGVKDMNGETGSIPDMTEHRSKAGLTEETQETEEGVKERDKNVVIDDNAGILFSSEWELEQDLKEVAVKDHSNELVNDQFDDFEFRQTGNDGKENCKQEGIGIETNSEADLNLTKEPAKDIDMNSETGSIPDMTEHRSKAGLTGEGVKDMNGETGSIPDMTEHRSNTGLTGEGVKDMNGETGSIPDMTEHRSKAGLTGEGVKDMNGETGSIPDMTEHRSKAGLTEETQETEEGVKERDKNVVIDDNAGILFSSEWELEQDLKEVAVKDHSNELVNDQFDDFEFRQTGNDGKENCKQEGVGIETNSEADLNLTKEPAKDIDMNSETGSIPDMTEHRSKAGLTGEGVKDMNGETGSIPDMTEHRSKAGLTGEGVKDMNGETGSIPDMTEHRSKAGLTEETQETEEGVKERDKNVVIDDNAGILFSSEWELEQDLKEVAVKDHSNELVNDQFDDFEFRQTGNDGKENCKQEGVGIETNSEADLNLTKEPAKDIDMNSETGSIPDMTEHRSKAGLTGEGVKDMNGETGSIPDMTEHRSKAGLTQETVEGVKERDKNVFIDDNAEILLSSEWELEQECLNAAECERAQELHKLNARTQEIPSDASKDIDMSKEENITSGDIARLKGPMSALFELATETSKMNKIAYEHIIELKERFASLEENNAVINKENTSLIQTVADTNRELIKIKRTLVAHQNVIPQLLDERKQARHSTFQAVLSLTSNRRFTAQESERRLNYCLQEYHRCPNFDRWEVFYTPIVSHYFFLICNICQQGDGELEAHLVGSNGQDHFMGTSNAPGDHVGLPQILCLEAGCRYWIVIKRRRGVAQLEYCQFSGFLIG